MIPKRVLSVASPAAGELTLRGCCGHAPACANRHRRFARGEKKARPIPEPPSISRGGQHCVTATYHAPLATDCAWACSVDRAARALCNAGIWRDEVSGAARSGHLGLHHALCWDNSLISFPLLDALRPRTLPLLSSRPVWCRATSITQRWLRLFPARGWQTAMPSARKRVGENSSPPSPALEALCRRFKGFGREHAVPEQIAALRGLAAISTRDAATAVSCIIADNVVQGPAVHDAVQAAVLLGCRLPPVVSLPLLRHNDASVRAAACRCARPHADVVPLLIDLLDDLHRVVTVAAACALGRAGRMEAQPMLARLLRDEPTAEVIDAVSFMADEDCIVELGRIARTNPMLSAVAIEALDAMDNPRAQAVAAEVCGTV